MNILKVEILKGGRIKSTIKVKCTVILHADIAKKINFGNILFSFYNQFLHILWYCSTQAQAQAQLSLSSPSFAWRDREASTVNRQPATVTLSSQAPKQPTELKLGTGISFRGYMKIPFNFFL